MINNVHYLSDQLKMASITGSIFSDGTNIYSVDMMFVYLKQRDYPITTVPLNEFSHTFGQKCWGISNIIRYSPNDVMAFPNKYEKEYDRIMKVDLSYPIIIIKNSWDGYCVIDGMHRLSYSLLNNITSIKTYVFNEDLLKKFRLN